METVFEIIDTHKYLKRPWVQMFMYDFSPNKIAVTWTKLKVLCPLCPVSKCVFNDKHYWMISLLVWDRKICSVSGFWLIQSLHLKRKSHGVTVKNRTTGISLLPSPTHLAGSAELGRNWGVRGRGYISFFIKIA